QLQHLDEMRKARSADDLHDLLRVLGDLNESELAVRSQLKDVAGALKELQAEHRVIPVTIGRDRRWIAAEDAGRYRDALGVKLPAGVPPAFLKTVADPLIDVLARYARSHGPFALQDISGRHNLADAVVHKGLRNLEVAGRVLEGEFRPGGQGKEWVD